MKTLIFFFCVLYIEEEDSMKRKTFPKGTRESLSKGFMSKNGTKHFVHVTNTNEFYRSYPVWRSKNPRTNHVYEFNGHLATGNQIMTFLRGNMKPSAPRRSPRRTVATTSNSASTSTTNPYRRVTRSMTRTSRSPSTSSNGTSRTMGTRRRKQSKPVRSYFE